MKALLDIATVVANSSTAHKTVQVKIKEHQRKQERQQDRTRVYMAMENFWELGIDSKDPLAPIYIWKAGEPEETRRQAVASLPHTPDQKSLGRKNVHMSKDFRDACALNISDDIHVCAAARLEIAEMIVVRDLSEVEGDDDSALSERDRPHWEWNLEGFFERAEIIYPGMILKDVSLKGVKRTLVVETVNGSTRHLGRYRPQTTIRIAKKHERDSLVLLSGPPKKLQVVDIAGIDQALKKLNDFLSTFDRKFKCAWANGHRSCAFLLHGTRGTGKTFVLSKIVGSDWGKPFHIESDAKSSTIIKVFNDAMLAQPSIIVLDDFEELVGRDDSTSHNIAKLIGSELDKLLGDNSTSLPKVLVAAATTDFSKIPLSLRRVGRFNTEIALPAPDTSARKAILKSLAPPFNPKDLEEMIVKLAERTHAYTAEDLISLLVTACDIAERRWAFLADIPGLEYFLAQDDLEKALVIVRPTAMHDVTLRPPIVRWDQIGGQDDVKKALRIAFERPLQHPDRLKRLGAAPTKGLLLYGPPGCSKTLSAQAMATEAGFNFFAVKGAELLNMYVGESERAVRRIFSQARAASPSIIFFDEIESIGSKRGSGGRNNGVNVLTTLLNEMDGIEALKGVTVLAATNQPQALDLALLRPGRFDKHLYVAPPDRAGREQILKVQQRKMDFAADVDIPELAELTDGFSGAELVQICQEACDETLERCEVTDNEEQVGMDDFRRAIPRVKRQITPELIEGYERWAAGV